MYSIRAHAALGMSNQDALSKDLESDPFLYSALQRFTYELYYRFDLFLALLSIKLILSRHYLLEQKVMSTKNSGTNGPEERNKRMAGNSKYAGLGAAMAAEWFLVCHWSYLSH